MKVRLTKYGWPEVAVVPAVLVALMVVSGLVLARFAGAWVVVAVEIGLSCVLVLALAFFRDPPRRCPNEPGLVLAPADGTVTEIDSVDRHEAIGGPALKIGIFLSIFDAHINRAPCAVRVEQVAYRTGKFVNAMRGDSGRVNESNELTLVRTEEPKDRLVVRQISGAIARRIVCAAKEGQILSGGEPFGMIKFGSRTELYVPVSSDIRCLVSVGDKVKAGLTVLLEYQKCEASFVKRDTRYVSRDLIFDFLLGALDFDGQAQGS